MAINTPTFLQGMASLFDFGDTLTPTFATSLPPEAADSLALRTDFAAVGADLYDVIQKGRPKQSREQLELPLGATR